MRLGFLGLWIAIALAACTDFSTVDRGVCGNGLLEAGEDCDSSESRCVRCAVTCSTAADCPTTDYACGVDGLCHAPGGGLAQPRSAGSFQANELAVTDIDHDGIGDAIGLSRTSVVIRHGEATGALGTLDSLVTPTQTGPAALGDLDNDGTLDLTLTTADGLVSYASVYGELAPIAVNSAVVDKDTGDPLDFRKFFHIAPLVIAGFLVDPATDNMFIVALDGGKGADPNPVFIAPCVTRLGVLKASAFDTASLEVFNVTKATDNHYDAVLSFTTGTGAGRRGCILAVHRNAPALFQPPPVITFTDITPTALNAPAKKPILADLDTDNDGCPGVVKQDGGLAALTYHDGSQASASVPCALAASTALPALPDAPTNAVLVGRGPVRPSVFSAASDGLVTNEGVYPYFPSGYLFITQPTFAKVYETTRNIVAVTNGDLDGDGNVDLVLRAAGDQDLDVLFRAPSQPGFNLVRIDTTSDVTTITTGDFDGNNIADIAYTEDLGDHQRLLVAYGTPDRPLAPVSVGVFDDIIDVGRIGFPDSVDYLGLADDLLVLQPPGIGEMFERLTILHGSPQRTMLSYFDPRSDTVKDQTLFRGAVIGHFVNTGTPDLADLVAIAPPSPQARSSTGGSAAVRAYRVPNSINGLDGTTSSGVNVDGLADCSLNDTSKLCLDQARYIAFPTGTNHDIVIGIDRSNAAVMVDPWAGSVSATQLTTLTSIVPAKSIVQSMQRIDLEGDGTLELLATFAPTSADSKGAIIVCAMTNGMPSSCEDLVPAILEAAAVGGPAVTSCFDATAARISYRDPTIVPDNRGDLAVACRGEGTSIFRVHRGSEGLIVDRLATTGAEISAIRAGDVTGDQIEDLLLLEGTAATTLIVYPQCTSRDAASCHATTAEESP
jgi:hypothetical protein